MSTLLNYFLFVDFLLTDFHQLCRSRIWNASIWTIRTRRLKRWTYSSHLNRSIEHDSETVTTNESSSQLDADEAHGRLAQHRRLKVATKLHVTVLKEKHEEVRKRRHFRGEVAEDLSRRISQDYGTQSARSVSQVRFKLNSNWTDFFYN